MRRTIDRRRARWLRRFRFYRFATGYGLHVPPELERQCGGVWLARWALDPLTRPLAERLRVRRAWLDDDVPF